VTELKSKIQVFESVAGNSKQLEGKIETLGMENRRILDILGDRESTV